LLVQLAMAGWAPGCNILLLIGTGAIKLHWSSTFAATQSSCNSSMVTAHLCTAVCSQAGRLLPAAVPAVHENLRSLFRMTELAAIALHMPRKKRQTGKSDQAAAGQEDLLSAIRHHAAPLRRRLSKVR
jgi:hypothetical protein